MPQAPDSLQPNMGYQPHPFKQALDHVVNTIMSPQGSGNQQPWGFHEPTVTAGQAVGPAAQATSDALADPRNAWMGVGPMVMMSRFRRVPDLGRELGGFNVPTNTMRRDLGIPRPNYRRSEVPGGDEPEIRNEYLNGLQGMNALAELTAQGKSGALLSMLTPQGKEFAERVFQGQKGLTQEVLRQQVSGMGGGELTPMQLRRFGFKSQ